MRDGFGSCWVHVNLFQSKNGDGVRTRVSIRQDPSYSAEL